MSSFSPLERPIRMIAPAAALALALLAAMPRDAAAQSATGRIQGRILDSQTGHGIADAGISVVGTTLGARSAEDGRFLLPRTPAGTVTLHVRRLGYQPKTITGILLPDGGSIDQDIALDAGRLELDAVVVSAVEERGSVDALLNEQRNATGIVSAVGSEQIARSPDRDAAQVVQRVSGITVQDGKYVYARGLGERYTTVSLDGVRVPSPEPSKKSVPLDLFPAGMIQSITTAKSFTPDLPGDFSGAQVDIRLRDVPVRRVMSLSTSVGYNDALTGQHTLAAPTTGLEWLAFAARERRLPAPIAAHGALPASLTQDDQNRLVNAFRNAWTPQDAVGTPNYSSALSLGGDLSLGSQRFGYIGALSYSSTQEARRNERRALAVPVSLDPVVIRPFNAFEGSTGRRSVLWGGVLNLTTWIGGGTKLSLSNAYDRGADNEAHADEGFYQDEIYIRRNELQYVERSVRSNQLRGEHALAGGQTLEWSVASSGVSRSEPDRSYLTYGRQYDAALNDTLPLALLPDPGANKRTFSALSEHVWSGGINYARPLGSGSRPSTVKIGAAYRGTHRDANQDAFDLLVFRLSQAQREAPAEQIFDGRYAQPGDSVMHLSPNQQGGAYRVTERIPAAYAMVEYPLGERLRLATGARVERWELSLDAQGILVGNVHVRRRTTDLLPAAILNVKLSDAQSLRVGASQTLSRPEYREIAPISYPGGYGDQIVFGNAALTRALIRNLDARWEWYPSAGEALSVAAFAKWFQRPIEQVDVATSGKSQLSFINANGATNYGVELEVRTTLGRIVPWLTPFGVFANATLMTSDIDVADTTRSALTNDNRAMVGQAPYVVNAGLTYAMAGGATSATLLYGVVGRRIHSAGVEPLPDTYEERRHRLDFSLRFPIRGGLTGKLDAKNLLDSPYRLTQGSVTREHYTVGRTFALGVTWSR